MTNEDAQKIEAIADGLDAAIRDAWPGLIARSSVSGVTMPNYVREALRIGVTRLRNQEAFAEAERKRAAALEAAQAARPDHAQQAYDGSWWWRVNDRWTNGLDRDTQPPDGVRWRALIGDGTRAHDVDGGTPLCGRSPWSGLRLAGPDVPPCVVCQRAADRAAAR